MIFMFEDFPTDALSILFRYSLSDTICEKFRYAKGAPKMVNMVKEILNNSEEALCVFLDLIPGNSSVTATYRNLKVACKAYTDRVIVIPIVCMEYYFIKSIASNIKLFKDYKIINDCIEKKPFFESELIETDEDFKYCKYFERFCKLILMKNVKDCVKAISKDNLAYNFYYNKNCLCEKYTSDCYSKLVLQKSLDFVKEFVFTKFQQYYNTFYIDDYLKKLHNNAIDEFNQWVDIFKASDHTNHKDVKYNHISKFIFNSTSTFVSSLDQAGTDNKSSISDESSLLEQLHCFLD